MEFSLPKLSYAFDALEPYIDAKTMEIHYSKHHQAYTDKLNAALKNAPEMLEKPIESILINLMDLPKHIRAAVKNNGGGYFNHTLFWEMMSPNNSQKPSGELLHQLEKSFDSFESFKEKFASEAIGRFGSGWAWLIKQNGALRITSTQNQDNPIMEDPSSKILLGIDVWEHAYYLKYQNKRPEYIDAWWNVVNWKKVEENFSQA